MGVREHGGVIHKERLLPMSLHEVHQKLVRQVGTVLFWLALNELAVAAVAGVPVAVRRVAAHPEHVFIEPHRPCASASPRARSARVCRWRRWHSRPAASHWRSLDAVSVNDGTVVAQVARAERILPGQQYSARRPAQRHGITTLKSQTCGRELIQIRRLKRRGTVAN